jgi:hypothetical protein
MWKRGLPLPSGIGGGEKPHEELPLSVMSSKEAIESVEEIEDEDKSHVDMKRSSAMSALEKSRVLISLTVLNFCFFFRQQPK